jgi:hypothetical protein
MTAQPNQPGHGLPRRGLIAAIRLTRNITLLMLSSEQPVPVAMTEQLRPSRAPARDGFSSPIFNGLKVSEFEQSAIPLDVYSLRVNGETENACGR